MSSSTEFVASVVTARNGADMDLLAIEPGRLYFDEPIAEEAARLLEEAADGCGAGEAELPLLRAYRIAPDSLSVLVALYRFYYYQQRLDDALQVADRAWRVGGASVGFPADWRRLRATDLAGAVMRSMGHVRFCLMALKAGGYLCLRLGRLEEARERLRRVYALDERDRLGAGALLALVGTERIAV